MSLRKRQLYCSSNGDQWCLVRDGGKVFVRHEANRGSGGHVEDIDVGSFLVVSGPGPQQEALLRLIGTLVED